MIRKKLVPFLAIGALALAVVTGVTAFHNVQAASTTINNAAGGVAALDFGRGFGGRGGDVTNQQLATALGIDVTKLTAAQTTATDQALAQAVTKGLITQSQADQMKANGYAMQDFNQFSANGIDYKALLASALGITTDKLNSAYIQAYNTAIDAEVTNGNLTQTQADLMKARYALANNAKLQSSLQSAYTAAVNQAVTDGVITQSQADQILKSNAGNGFDLFGGKMGGGPGGFGGHGRGGGNLPGNNNPNSTTPGSATPTPSAGL